MSLAGVAISFNELSFDSSITESGSRTISLQSCISSTASLVLHSGRLQDLQHLPSATPESFLACSTLKIPSTEKQPLDQRRCAFLLYDSPISWSIYSLSYCSSSSCYRNQLPRKEPTIPQIQTNRPQAMSLPPPHHQKRSKRRQRNTYHTHLRPTTLGPRE